MAKVAAINISEIRGIQKHEIPEAFLKEDWGIEGDAHAGNWHRQVSLLSTDSVKVMQDKLDFNLEHGAFAENILVEGMEVHTLPVGTRLKIGEALTEVTQIGKECHKGCAIREITGDCVMPKEGIFVKVLQSGNVKTGDEISIYEDKIRKTKVKAGVMLRMVGNAGFSLFIEKRVQIEIFKTKSEKF